MFCPQCGAQADQGIKYCKQCGINLRRIQGVMSRGGASANWNDVWMEEALEDQRSKRKKTPEEKRIDEIKGGVITSSAGLAITIFFSFLFNAIANNVGGSQAEILRSLWAIGLVPLFIGLGIVFNGVYLSKRIVELKHTPEPSAQPLAPPQPQPLFGTQNTSVDTAKVAQLPAANAQSSVTEHTTAHLGEATAVNVQRKTN
jgi:hypothetical protein